MSIDATQLEINSDLKDMVSRSTDLKSLVVEFVGTTLKPENDEVTLEMVIGLFAAQFPEFMLALAEENWLRGYKMGLEDAETAARLTEDLGKVEKSN